jgi:hypothetical protein
VLATVIGAASTASQKRSWIGLSLTKQARSVIRMRCGHADLTPFLSHRLPMFDAIGGSRLPTL